MSHKDKEDTVASMTNNITPVRGSGLKRVRGEDRSETTTPEDQRHQERVDNTGSLEGATTRALFVTSENEVDMRIRLRIEIEAERKETEERARQTRTNTQHLASLQSQAGENTTLRAEVQAGQVAQKEAE